jgi:hypothetical protein
MQITPLVIVNTNSALHKKTLEPDEFEAPRMLSLEQVKSLDHMSMFPNARSGILNFLSHYITRAHKLNEHTCTRTPVSNIRKFLYSHCPVPLDELSVDLLSGVALTSFPNVVSAGFKANIVEQV